jgi:uncharacterized protein (DUF305 family)
MTMFTRHAAGRAAIVASEAPPRSTWGGWRSPPVVAFALLAIVALSLALAASLGLRVTRFPGDRSAEAGFARDMGVHHAQGVEMAELVRDRTADPDLRLLAIDITLTQQAQIGQMDAWLEIWGLPPTGAEPAMTWMGHPTAGLMPGMATPEDLARLREAPAAEAESDFLRLMIRHHRAGVDMAQGVLARTQRPEVRRLAAAIVAGQTSEIRAMEEMLARRGLVPSDAGPSSPPSGGSHGTHSAP